MCIHINISAISFHSNLKRNTKTQLSFKRLANYLLHTKCSIMCKKFVLNYLKSYWKQSTHKCTHFAALLTASEKFTDSPHLSAAGFCHFSATNFCIHSLSASCGLHARQKGQLQATNAIIYIWHFFVANAAWDVAVANDIWKIRIYIGIYKIQTNISDMLSAYANIFYL